MKNKIAKVMRFLRDPQKMRRYIGWLWNKTRPALPSLSLLLVLDLAAVVIGFVSSFISRHVVDSATAGLEFWPAFGVMIAITVVSLGISSLVSVFTTLINERFAFGIRLKVYDGILDANFMGLSRYHSGDLLTRMTSDVDSVSNGIASAIPNLFTIGFRLISAFIILFSYTPGLAVAALALGPVGLLMSLLVGEKLKKLSAEVKENEAAYRSFIQENLANVTVVKTFCMEEHSRKRLSDLRSRMLSTILRRNRLSVVMNLCIRGLFSLGYLIAFGYCISGLHRNVISYGTMTLFLTLFAQIQQPIMSVAHLIPQCIGIVASAGRIMEIEDIPADLHTGAGDISRRVGLRFDNVSFSYAEDAVLRDVSFTVDAGQFVGIMGPSGVGKTTLIRLALALIAPEKGRVEFITDSGKEQASADSRRHIAYVPQGNTLFSGTIAENLRYGDPHATEDDMWRALDCAAADFVRSLPKGLNTPIGEKASGISEGQAQRIAIARALLRKAPVLILDEATSALDADAEERILTYLSKPDREYAPLCLAITHRRSMASHFDRLLEIDESGAARMTVPGEGA